MCLYINIMQYTSKPLNGLRLFYSYIYIFVNHPSRFVIMRAFYRRRLFVSRTECSLQHLQHYKFLFELYKLFQ